MWFMLAVGWGALTCPAGLLIAGAGLIGLPSAARERRRSALRRRLWLLSLGLGTSLAGVGTLPGNHWFTDEWLLIVALMLLVLPAAGGKRRQHRRL